MKVTWHPGHSRPQSRSGLLSHHVPRHAQATKYQEFYPALIGEHLMHLVKWSCSVSGRWLCPSPPLRRGCTPDPATQSKYLQAPFGPNEEKHLFIWTIQIFFFHPLRGLEIEIQDNKYVALSSIDAFPIFQHSMYKLFETCKAAQRQRTSISPRVLRQPTGRSILFTILDGLLFL